MVARRRTLTALNRSLKAMELRPEAEATAALAREYARGIDADAETLWRLGPRLLEALESLGMTPRARAAIFKGGEPEDPTASPIDELRARRQQRSAQ